MCSDLNTAAIRARVDAATPGPWQWGLDVNRRWALLLAFSGTAEEERLGRLGDDDDAEFVAHARTDLPALLNEVDRLRKVIEDAPHAGWCSLSEWSRNPCDCWKASAVGTNNEEGN